MSDTIKRMRAWAEWIHKEFPCDANHLGTAAEIDGWCRELEARIAELEQRLADVLEMLNPGDAPKLLDTEYSNGADSAIAGTYIARQAIYARAIAITEGAL